MAISPQLPRQRLRSIANSSEVSSGGVAGSSSNSVGWAFQSGPVQIDGTAIGTAAANFGEQGDIVGMAVDLGAQLIWFRFSRSSATTNWNNSGAANPATGVGGFSLSTLAAGPYFAFVTLNQSTDTYTANFGASPYVLAAPSGFGNW
jgi:hypothetical protein